VTATSRRTIARGRAAGAGAAVVVALALGACTGPPWFMGQPLGGPPAVPDTRKNPSWKTLQADAGTARIKGQTVLELPALIALDDLQRLEPFYRERLATLLERRAAEFRALRRPIPESRDLERLARLTPARAPDLLDARRDALRAAGDEWLAVGAMKEARAAYEQAVTLGAADMNFRVRAASGQPPPPSTTRAELRFEIAALPLRALPPLALAYVEHGGRDRATLARGLAAARQQKDDGLAVRLADTLRAAEARGRASDEAGADGGAPDGEGAGDAAAPDGDAAAADAAPADAPPADEAADAAFDGGAVPVPADLVAWSLAGVTVSARLLPLIDAHPEILDDVERAVAWVDLLLDEDQTSPRILALAALVFGRASRFGGTERMLMELAYATPDRALGLARGAEIWEQLGRRREACAQWLRAARWRDDPEDPTWRTAIACTRRDPGVGSWREIRDYVLGRASPERRAAIAASLDAP
jgi:hypothetical protein